MAIDTSKLKKVYDTLKGGGYEQDYDSFKRGFLGNSNYENRKQVYNLLSNNGAQIGGSYEEFMKNMQAPKAQVKPAPQVQPRTATPMTAEERNRYAGIAGGIIAGSRENLARAKRKIDYTNKQKGLDVRPTKVGVNESAPVKLGQNRKVVEESNLGKPTYTDEEGNQYDNRAQADLSQGAIDDYKEQEINPVEHSLKEAYSERERLEKAIAERRQQLEERNSETPWYARIIKESAGAAHSGIDPNATGRDSERQGFENDEQYMQLMSALRKNRQTITTLEDKKQGKMNEFWHNFANDATNGYTFSDGMSEMRDATAIENAQKHIDSINRKRQKGEQLTQEELAAEAVLKNANVNDQIQAKYGQEYGAWARAGGMAAVSLDFMKDFLFAPGATDLAKGISKGITKAGMKVAGKYIAKEAGEGLAKASMKALARGTLKATGMFIGAHTAGAAISNTTGIGRTIANMAGKTAGNVTTDKQGNYKVENQDTIMHALVSAEREQMRENGSEMAGEFIPGGKYLGNLAKKGLEKIGLSKVAGFLASIGNKQWYKQYTTLLEKGGYNGIPGEALEEYEGSLFDALTGHAGDAYRDMTDKRNHVDIWLGCATMGALMGAVPLTMHTAEYMKYKHGLNKADKSAARTINPEQWDLLKEKIDGTDNANMAQVVVKDIFDNKELNVDEKSAALNYVRNLTKYRGFNIAQANNAKEEEEHTPQEAAVEATNNSYSDGYNAEDERLAPIKDEYEMQLKKMENSYGEDSPIIDEIDEDPISYAEKVRAKGDEAHAEEVLEYANAKAAYDGMIQRVRDDLDNKIEDSNAAVDERTNKEDGLIYPATMKQDDRKVYIVKGNVVMHDDGNGVNNSASSDVIYIRDAESGKLEMSTPEQVLSVDAPIDAAQEKQESAEAIQQSFAQEKANMINGVVDFAQGTTHQLLDEQGQQHDYTILQDNGDGSVAVAIDNNTSQPVVMSKEQLQDMANFTRKASAQQAEEEVQAPFGTENAEDSQQQNEIEQPEPAVESEEAEAPAMPMTDEGDPDFAKVEPTKAYEYLQNEAGLSKEELKGFVDANLSEATKALEKAKKNPPTIGTSLQKYNQAKQEYSGRVEEAQAKVDYWNAVKGELDKADAVELRKRAEVQAEETRKAKEAEEQRQQEELQKQAEQKERGANNVAQSIKEKWDNATKIDGAKNEIILPNGERISGHYVLTESGAASASHNATSEFAKTEGFPVDENGQSVNDRDYERDKDAQNVTRNIARDYDSRALQTPVVVSKDGVVLSGNGRTMAGELAARDNTDTAYTEHLQKYPQQYGFTTEQVKGMKHPRVVFVPDVDMPYNAETFAKFNQQEMKGQNKTEHAVKLGKVVDDNTFARIIRSVNSYDTLGDFYADNKATHEAIKELIQAGVLSEAQAAEMFDGDGISIQGKEVLENMLIGKAFESNPDAVREITTFKSMRQSIITALAEIVNNKALGEEYSLEKELAEAIDLVYKARKDSHKAGDKVSYYARQQNLFAFDEGDTIADYTNATMLMLADVLNDSRSTQLKKILSVYNQKAADSAAGQLDMFSGSVKSKEEIWNDVKRLIDYGTEEEQQRAIREATEQRKASVQQNEPVSESDEGNEPRPIGTSVFGKVYDQFKGKVKEAIEFLVNHKSGNLLGVFHRDDIGDISLVWGDSKGGLEHIIKRHIEDQNDFRNIEEAAKVIQQTIDNGAITRENIDKVVIDYNDYRVAIQKQTRDTNGNVIENGNWVVTAFDKSRSKKEKASSEKTLTTPPSNRETNGVTLPLNDAFIGKDNKLSDTKQEISKENVSDNEDLFAKAERIASVDKENRIRKAEEAKVDTNPTEKQKEAGNYKKGHIKVDGLDVTIEQPKGSIRRGTDANGNKWESEMHNTYGYIKGTESVDGDHIDIFLSDNPAEGNVYVVDQVNKDGSFDEHKVMYGFADMESAEKAYLSNYEKGWQGLGSITGVSKEDFKKWVDSSKRKTKPFAKYSSVKTEGDVKVQHPIESKGSNRLVTDERYAELKKRMRAKLGQLNMGVDPEVLAIGTEMAVYHIEKGTRKFVDFAKAMIEDLGDAVRPYLKAFYNGARDMPEMEELSKDMTSYEEVRAFDVATIGKKGEEVSPTLFDTAEQINNEQAIEHNIEQEENDTKEAKEDSNIDNDNYSITKQHNNKKDVDIWVVRDKGERTSRDAYLKRKGKAKQHGGGYWSNFVKGFVFNNSDDAKSFADETFSISEPKEVKEDKQEESKSNDVGPTAIDFNSLYNTLATKGEAKISDHAIKDEEEEKPTEKVEEDHHGLKVGDKVLYKGKEATIFDFENGKPVLDTGFAPVLYEAVNYKDIAPLPGKEEQQEEEKPKESKPSENNSSKENNDKKKAVSLKQDNQLDLFGNENTDNKPKQNNNEKIEVRPGTSTAQRERGHQSEPHAQVGESARNENERTDSGRMGGRSESHPQSDTTGSTGLSKSPVSSERLKKNQGNNHVERGEQYAPKTELSRIKANISAIKLMQQLIESGEKATPEQMAVLRSFSGWGGLGSAFTQSGWTKNPTREEIKSLLGEEAFLDAEMSRNSAYYTPTHIIDSMWDIAKALGFKGGRILEGSAGVGNILGQMPKDISENSDIHAVEKDSTTGGILSLLYPNAKVDIQGFEDTRIPNGSIDLAITNVPFITGLHVIDTTGDKDLSRRFRNIHDFCIAKNVRKLSAGGIGIFISSNGTLDNSQSLRDWLVSDGGADVIGAFRLNNETFGGTGATSDIIVVRKRVNGKKSVNAIDVSKIASERVGEYLNDKDKPTPLSMDYNSYFVNHPENMGGVMKFGFEEDNTFRPTSKACYPQANINQDERLKQWAKDFENKREESNLSTAQKQDETPTYSDLGSDVKEGSLILNKNNELCIAHFGKAVPLDVNDNKVKGHSKQECFKAYTEIKNALNKLLDYQTNNTSDEGLKPLQEKLSKAFDSFTETYGHFQKNPAISFLRNDLEFSNVAALESMKEGNDDKGNRVQTFTKGDVFNKRVVSVEKEVHPKDVKEGVLISQYKNGRVDVSYIAKELGKGEEDVKQEILSTGLGFEDPISRDIVISYDYLSGNVREKLTQARESNDNGIFDKNIQALENVMPSNIPPHLIEFNIGSSWIPTEVFEKYIKEKTDLSTKVINLGGSWSINTLGYEDIGRNREFGVYSEKCDKQILGHELIEAAMTNKSIVVHKKIDDKDVSDKEATQACATRVDEIRDDFKDWMREKMQADEKLSNFIEKEYNDKFNNYVPKSIPDDMYPKHFVSASHDVTLRSHQARAAVRGTMENLMLAHEVGSGKTYTLITTAMEMRRLGTAKKPMVVVQNSTIDQFSASAKKLYPNAKILALENKDRGAEGRKTFYAKIKYNDWDMIIVPQSTFNQIPDSKEREITFIHEKIDEKVHVLESLHEAGASNRDLKKAEREIVKLYGEAAMLAEQDDEQVEKKPTDTKKRAVAMENASVRAKEMLDRKVDDVANFDDMGIDALLIDEAHEYKHLGFATAMQRGVKGIDPSYSKKSQGVYLKCQSVMEKSGGKNVVFATGTPISNTAAEIWSFMRYLMPKHTMEDYGIYYFDDFARNFGNISQMNEFKTNGKFEEVNRFKGYINLPELARIWSSVSDTFLTEEATDLKEQLPKLVGDKAEDIYLPQTKSLRMVMKFVKNELAKYEKLPAAEKKNNPVPLVMYGIAKAAAVDPRLVMNDAEDEPNSKTNEAVRRTLKALEDTKAYKGTIAIFADVYKNKQSGFNLYRDIKEKLIKAGVPEDEIAIVNDLSQKKKQEVFDKVNAGDIRVVLGSTFTLGTGVNIQERLNTLIHLDAPNRPMDYTQRNGRILRQGNIHKDMDKEVHILRFGVEDSLDVTAYQRLKTKGEIAGSVMRGKQLMQDAMNNRNMEEEEDVFGDVVAQLSGSEYALMKQQAERELRKYNAKHKQWEADQIYIHKQKPALNAQINSAKAMLDKANEALSKIEQQNGDNKISVNGKMFKDIEGMDEFFKAHNKSIKDAIDKLKESKRSESQERHTTLTIGGFDFDVKTNIEKEITYKGINIFNNVHRTMTYSCKELGLEDVPVKNGYIKNAVTDILEDVVSGNDFRERIDTMSKAIERYDKELKQLTEREGKPFEYEKELEAAKAHVEEYTEKMKEELAAKEAKYADLDKDIKAAEDLSEAVEDDEDVLYRGESSEDIEDVNDKFNEELRKQINGTLPRGHVYQLGMPSAILQSADIPNLPIELVASRLSDKSMQENHPFELEEVADLPRAIQQPLAIFRSATHVGSNVILTNIKHDHKNYVVAIETNKRLGKIQVNSIRSVHYRNNMNIVGWINDGLIDYVSDELRNEWLPQTENELLSKPQYNSADVRKKLISAAKIIKDFHNPNINADILRDSEESVSEVTTSNTSHYTKAQQQAYAARQIRRAHEMAQTTIKELHLNDKVDIIEDADSAGLEGKRAKAKGWYDPKTDRITIVIGNHRSPQDVVTTILHEAVAHYGLRKLFGNHFDDFIYNVYAHGSDEVRRAIANLALKKYGGKIDVATEEYLARLAEDTNFEYAMQDNWFEKIKRWFFDMLHKIGFKDYNGEDLSDNELRYILWRSFENLKEPGRYRSILGAAADIDKQNSLSVGNYNKENTSESMSSHAADNNKDSDILLRDNEGDPEVHERKQVREKYEKRIRSGLYQTQEAMIDSMRSLHDAMLMIADDKKHIEDIEGFENAYLGENRLSSVNEAEVKAFATLLFNPLLNEVSKIAKTKEERQQLTDYMMAKHGLERNLLMAKRAARKEFKAYSQKEGQTGQSFNDFLAIARKRDFAGLTSLTGEETTSAAEEKAKQMVKEYEAAHDTRELWNKVRNVNNATLAKNYESGLMNKDTYEYIKSMYKYYVPLRGFDEDTSQDAYAYITQRDSAFNAPIQKTKGRSSKANDIFANMESMAESAIAQGNRNVLVKQRFLNFVLNHPSDLVSVGDLWLKHNKEDDQWEPVFPNDIEAEDSAEDVARKLQEFEERMTKLQEEFPEDYKHGADAVNIPYRIVDSRDLHQHQVVVKRNGRDIVLTINGNPRLAQALNGMTNPDAAVRGSIGAMLNVLGEVNRTLSALYTTFQPDFIVSNFLRDTIYSNSMVWIKEEPKYAAKYNVNFTKLPLVKMKLLLAQYRKGELDMDNEVELMFQQFMRNGGETGFLRMADIESHKKEIEKTLKSMGSNLPLGAAREALVTWVGEVGRAIEMRARFAAFVTSREVGRSIDRAIWDSKEISVNFNKKGAGDTMLDMHGQTLIGNTSSFISGVGRMFYVFWNAAMQGTFNNFGKYGLRHPAKAITLMLGAYSMGLLISALGAGGDDDSYYDLPETTRRQNILIKGPGNTWIKIPLSIEYRSIYGMGELAGSTIFHKERLELGDLVAQMSQILPIDFMEGKEAFYPSSVKPVIEVANNRSWYGSPIWKETEYNKPLPQWTKAFKSANRDLVNLAALLNEVSGGNKYKKGEIDLNPAAIEYLLRQYTGGAFTVYNQLRNMTDVAMNNKDFDWRYIPLANRVVMTGGDEQNASRGLDKKFYDYLDRYKAKAAEINGFKNDPSYSPMKKAEIINNIVSDKDYLLLRQSASYYQRLSRAKKDAQAAGAEDAVKMIDTEIIKLKHHLVNSMEAREE
nr:MAG TPA: DNA methylase [Caudoviricetes sp.]